MRVNHIGLILVVGGLHLLFGCKYGEDPYIFIFNNETDATIELIELEFDQEFTTIGLSPGERSEVIELNHTSAEIIGPCVATISIVEYEIGNERYVNIDRCAVEISRENFNGSEVNITLTYDPSGEQSCPSDTFLLEHD